MKRLQKLYLIFRDKKAFYKNATLSSNIFKFLIIFYQPSTPMSRVCTTVKFKFLNLQQKNK